MSADQKPSHFLVLDGVRGVAALSVMLYHYTLYGRVLIFQRGDAAVDLFFMLSGFVLAHAYGARIAMGTISPRQFLLKRVIRLYPMFFAGVLIGIPVLWALCRDGRASYSGNQLVAAGLCNIFLLPYLNAGQVLNFQGRGPAMGAVFPTNDPAWSLFFEILGSVFFFWLAKFSSKALLRAAAVSLLAVVAYGSFINFQDRHQIGMNLNIGWGTDNLIGGLPRSLYGFACGVLLYRARRTIASQGAVRWLPGRTQTPIYLATFAVFLFPVAARGLYYLLVLALIAPMLVVAGASARCESTLSRRMASSLGWVSYPLYCVHYPVGRLTWVIGERYHLAAAGSWALVLIASLASILCAAVITSLWEMPMRGLLVRANLQRHDGAAGSSRYSRLTIIIW